ncbi:MAG: aspartate carbamoyltransferase regulatory subunit [Defluviitaleaceae bacterium]|nr:aspartate carbamoyltransferase regulatory subunit [Defluviitaleaceae bacterium]
MEITSITNGIIIDHLRAGSGRKVLDYINIKNEQGSIALIMNVKSTKHGRKDIIKLENVEKVDVNVLGLIDHNATVIYIRDGIITKKVKLSHPEMVTNVIECKNPRCITSTEDVPYIFHLADDSGKYRCEYCDNLVKSFEG